MDRLWNRGEGGRERDLVVVVSAGSAFDWRDRPWPAASALASKGPSTDWRPKAAEHLAAGTGGGNIHVPHPGAFSDDETRFVGAAKCATPSPPLPNPVPRPPPPLPDLQAPAQSRKPPGAEPALESTWSGHRALHFGAQGISSTCINFKLQCHVITCNFVRVPAHPMWRALNLGARAL